MIQYTRKKDGALIVNTYVNGVKSAIQISDGAIYLMSHCAKWDGTRPGKMHGWKFGRVIGTDDDDYTTSDSVVSLVNNSLGTGFVTEITFEGEPRYNEIRSKVEAHAAARRAAKESTPAEPAPATTSTNEEVSTPAGVATSTDEEVSTPAPAETSTTESTPAEPAVPTMDAAQAAIAGLFGGVTAQVTAQVMAQVKKMLAPIMDAAPVVHEVKVTLPDGSAHTSTGAKHEMYDLIVKYVALGQSVYLYGPAGTGKTTIAQDVAKVTGREFFSTSAIQEEFSLCGYNDANGRYIGTQFFQACDKASKGTKVVFCFDELDNSNPQVLKKFNTALANGYFDFPCGRVSWEKGAFVAIGTGNTCGTGATAEYNTSYKMDESTRNRFRFIFIDYCPAIEEVCARGNKELLRFCRAIRTAAKRAGVSLCISYRNISNFAQDVEMKLAALPILLNADIITGMEKDEINMILGQMTISDEYTTALQELAA